MMKISKCKVYLNSNNSSDLVINIEEAKSILDRVIGFVEMCDNKISIALGFYMAILSLLLVSDSNQSFLEVIKLSIEHFNIWTALLLFITAILYIVGIGAFLFAIYPRTKKYGYDKNFSVIYWEDIAKCYPNDTYLNVTQNMTEENYLEDIKRQIQINSKICKKKFFCYRIGLICSTVVNDIIIVDHFYTECQ